jgi:hypothetical protein
MVCNESGIQFWQYDLFSKTVSSKRLEQYEYGIGTTRWEGNCQG